MQGGALSARTAGIENRAGTVTRLIQEFNWEPLKMRRGRARLILFFKISMCGYPSALVYLSSHYISADPSLPSPEIYGCELWHLGVQVEFLYQHDKHSQQPTC